MVGWCYYSNKRGQACRDGVLGSDHTRPGEREKGGGKGSVERLRGKAGGRGLEGGREDGGRRGERGE